MEAKPKSIFALLTNRVPGTSEENGKTSTE